MLDRFYRWLTRPSLRQLLTDIQLDVAETRRSLLEIPTRNQLETIIMASDRDLLNAIADSVTALSPAVDNLIADRDQWRTRALTAEGAAATDEADDTAAAAPIKSALDALRDKLAPVASPAPSPIEEIPEAVSDAPDPAPASTDGESA